MGQRRKVWIGAGVALVVSASVTVAVAASGAGGIQGIPAATDPPRSKVEQVRPPALSGDGRLATFASTSDALVQGDTNRASDVFLVDRETGALQLVSKAADGNPANGYSRNPSLSADGRFVAFESRASNLVPGDTNSAVDVFLKDLQSGAIERLSVSAEGLQGNGASGTPALSQDGRFVAFWSEAGTLVAGDQNSTYDNGGYDIFVKDRVTGALERVSVSASGEEAVGDSLGPSISADGRFVAFGSLAGNLVADDANELPDIFVKDRQTGVVEVISRAADGSASDGASFWNPVMSADGRFVAFWSEAANLVAGDTNSAPDVFVKDRATGALERVSVSADGLQADARSYAPSMSADGRFVAFWSEATNLVAGDTNSTPDVFVKDRATGALERVSVSADGLQADARSYAPSMSADGRFVAFWSEATNLTPNGTSAGANVFVANRPQP